MRKAGVLMPVSALPSRIGAGELGESAFQFIELLKENHVKIWQILPLNPVGYGNSPYQPYSSCAGDELYISLDALAEEGLWEDPVTDEIARRYLAELIDIGIDTLILGCTHYPLIRNTIGRIMGDRVTLVNPAYETARELKELLQEKDLLNDETHRLGEEQYRFFVSDGAEKFKIFANSIIKYGILSAKVVPIEDYQGQFCE